MKYQALGLSVQARAQPRLGSKAATRDARDATETARALGDPAVLPNCLDVWRRLESREELLHEAVDTARRIAAAAGRQPSRRRFLAGLPAVITARL